MQKRNDQRTNEPVHRYGGEDHVADGGGLLGVQQRERSVRQTRVDRVHADLNREQWTQGNSIASSSNYFSSDSLNANVCSNRRRWVRRGARAHLVGRELDGHAARQVVDGRLRHRVDARVGRRVLTAHTADVHDAPGQSRRLHALRHNLHTARAA